MWAETWTIMQEASGSSTTYWGIGQFSDDIFNFAFFYENRRIFL